MTTEAILGFCPNGHGYGEVREYEGVLLCVRKCWGRRKGAVDQARAQRARVRKGKPDGNRS